MTYGILAAGVNLSSLKHLCVCQAKHLRALSKAPVHLYFESTSTLLARLQTPSIPSFLSKLARKRLATAEPAFEPLCGFIMRGSMAHHFTRLQPRSLLKLVKSNLLTTT